MVNDGLANKMIDPALLTRDYVLISEGEGEPTSIATPVATSSPPSLMTANEETKRKIEAELRRTYKPDGAEREAEEAKQITPAQVNYLSQLCERAGVPFDPRMSKAKASSEITRLKAELAKAPAATTA